VGRGARRDEGHARAVAHNLVVVLKPLDAGEVVVAKVVVALQYHPFPDLRVRGDDHPHAGGGHTCGERTYLELGRFLRRFS